MTRSLSSKGKHDADCLRRRADALYLCTCGLTDAEVAKAKESANPHSRAKSGLTAGVRSVDTPNRAGGAVNAPAHGTEGDASMQDDPTAKRPIIGRERALVNRLVKDLRSGIKHPTHGLGDSPRDRMDVYETRRGGVFEVHITVDGERTGHVVRVAVDLDRFEDPRDG